MSVLISIFIGIAILFIAFFAGIEVAFANANRLSIELKKKQGSSSGLLLSKLLDEPSRFIGTVLVGFNFFLVVFVLLVSIFWNILLNRWEVTSSAIVPIRLLLEILASMIVVIIFCDFIPKAIFRAKSDSLLSFSARSGLLGMFHDVFYPVAAMFVKISAWILNIIFDMRIDKKKEPFARADLEHFFQQTREYHDENQDVNTDLFEAALSLHKVKVRE
jgi:CBS domain containing-hemolysin-like protein